MAAPPSPALAAAPVVTALAVPSPEAIRHAIAEALRASPCSLATGDSSGGVTTLRGAAVRGAPEAELHAAVQDAAPAMAIDWQVGALEGPYCPVLDAVRAYAKPFGTSGRSLGITLANGKTSLVAKDLVVPRVSMPDFPAYLQLDYIASDGSVLHMHDATNGAPYPALAVPAFGEPKPGFGGWGVDEPFGTDLILGIASSAPLFPVARPATDTLDGYLRDLSAALDRASRSGARVSTSVLLVRTSPKPPR
jgi:eukaryotic-like serine/threonine-protein kinase